MEIGEGYVFVTERSCDRSETERNLCTKFSNIKKFRSIVTKREARSEATGDSTTTIR